MLSLIKMMMMMMMMIYIYIYILINRQFSYDIKLQSSSVAAYLKNSRRKAVEIPPDDGFSRWTVRFDRQIATTGPDGGRKSSGRPNLLSSRRALNRLRFSNHGRPRRGWRRGFSPQGTPDPAVEGCPGGSRGRGGMPSDMRQHGSSTN